jgi:hypothetical protein
MSDQTKVDQSESIPATPAAPEHAMLPEEPLTVREKLAILDKEIDRYHAFLIGLLENTRESIYSEQQGYRSLLHARLKLAGIELEK